MTTSEKYEFNYVHCEELIRTNYPHLVIEWMNALTAPCGPRDTFSASKLVNYLTYNGFHTSTILLETCECHRGRGGLHLAKYSVMSQWLSRRGS